MAYLGDAMRRICIAYFSAPFNLTDQGDKFPRDRTLLGRGNRNSRVMIGFRSRWDMGSLVRLVGRREGSSISSTSPDPKPLAPSASSMQ